MSLLKYKDLERIVKLTYIRSIFYDCSSLKDLQKVVKYLSDEDKIFHSWGEARGFLYQEMPKDVLETINYFYMDLLMEYEEKYGNKKGEFGKKTSHVLISYSLIDINKFQIKKIANKLKSYPNIKVRYFTEDVGEDIIEFMDEGVGWCNILLLFCSKNSKESDAVKNEWRSVLIKKKKIIPIFIDKIYIPNLLASKIGVEFDMSDLEGTIKKILKEILKRSEH